MGIKKFEEYKNRNESHDNENLDDKIRRLRSERYAEDFGYHKDDKEDDDENIDDKIRRYRNERDAEDWGFGDNSVDKGNEKTLTAKKFLFGRYKKYYPGLSWKSIEQHPLPMSRVAELMEEYYKEKTK